MLEEGPNAPAGMAPGFISDRVGFRACSYMGLQLHCVDKAGTQQAEFGQPVGLGTTSTLEAGLQHVRHLRVTAGAMASFQRR